MLVFLLAIIGYSALQWILLTANKRADEKMEHAKEADRDCAEEKG